MSGTQPKWSAKEDWRLVACLKDDVTLHLRYLPSFNNTREGIIYFYLYESNFGSRRMDKKTTLDTVGHDFDDVINRSEIYLEKVFPWLEGMNFNEIPGYNESDKSKK